MSDTVVSSWNDFDPLRHLILGRADHTCIPPTEPATEAKIPEDSPMRGRWGPRPLETVERANEQLDHFAAVLEGRGIRVDRPEPIQWNQAVVTPDFTTSCMFGCMPPRDVLLTVGREILSASMSFRCRYFEYLAYHPLMQRYFDEDPRFRWEQAPRPRLTDESYQSGYFDEITLEERLRRTAALDFVTTEHEPLFDAADVLRIGRDLFCQHGLTTNRRGMEWLRRHFPEHRVHAVNFPGDPWPIHIDATFVTLRPGLVINNPTRRLPEEQRRIFEANGWEIVDAAPPAHNEPPPAVLFEHLALDELPRARSEDGMRGGERARASRAARPARHGGDPDPVPGRLCLRRGPALCDRRRVPGGGLRGLLPQTGSRYPDRSPGAGLAPRAVKTR